MVDCPNCGSNNRPGANFCAQCATSLPATQSAYVALQPGQEMDDGRYRVVRPLSKGGMGAIYLVKDSKTFDRLGVIKEMLDYVDPSDQDAMQRAHERFEEEARTLASLRHPGIPEILVYFSENGRNYIVMQYVDGPDLEQGLTHNDDKGQSVPGKPYPVEDVIRWGIQVCRILEYLANITPDEPVVHQDIKPANLIFDQNSDQVRLVDFGTAKAKMVLQAGGTMGLQKSSVYGTIGYAPREQYEGRSEPRSDVYALSATLYHLLTDDDPRRHPFDFPLLKDLPDGVRDLLLQGLEEDVKRRPTAEKLRKGLEALLAPAVKKLRPFHFRSGAEARTLSDLVALCDTHWNDGIYHLYAGQFEPWLEDLGKPRLATEAARVRHAGGNQSVGLEQFLQATGLVPPPQPVADPSSLDFEQVRKGDSKTLEVRLSNRGRGFMVGQVQVGATWLSVTPTNFEGNSVACKVTVSPFDLAPTQVHQSSLEFGGQGFRVPVPVKVKVLRPQRVRKPLPKGLTFLLSLVVTVLCALLGWELIGRLGWELAGYSPIYLNPLRPEIAPSILVIGATTALGGVLVDRRRRQRIASKGGWRVLLEGLIAGTFFAALGTWLAAMLWYYALLDPIWRTHLLRVLREFLNLLFRATIVTGAVLGAAYGTFGPGADVLERVLGLIVKLLSLILWLVVAAGGAYLGVAIGEDQGWIVDLNGLWIAIGVGAAAAVLIVRALWKFVRDALRRR